MVERTQETEGRERALKRLLGGSVVGFLLRLVVTGFLSTFALQQIWPTGADTQRATPVVELNRAGHVLLSLDMIVVALQQYARTGDPAEHRAFEQRLSRFHETLALLQTSGEDERRVAMALSEQARRIESVGRMLVSIPDPRTDGAALRHVDQLNQLRDGAVLDVNRLREADIRLTAKSGQPPAGLVDQLGGAGLATLGLCLAGGLAAARFCVA